MDFNAIERAIGYVFKDKDILRRALTLSSYDGDENNQSMECFGDSILGFIVTEKYYCEGLSEGEITEMKKRLVSDEALTPVSRRLGLDGALLRGKGDTHNKKAVPSAYEALVAAVYEDGGMQAAKDFALSTLDFNAGGAETNYFVALKEYLEKQGKTLRKADFTVESCGTPVQPKFRASAVVNGRAYAAEAESKSKAVEQTAKLIYERECK